jgi:YcxB-like protein
MEEITADFQWDRAEYLRVARKAVLARLLRSMFLCSVGIIGVGVGAAIAGHAGLAEFLLGLGVIYVGMGFWMRLSIPTGTWRKKLELQSPIHLVFSDDGVTSKTIDTDSKMPWRTYPYSKEWSDYYLLKYSRRTVSRVVPKRAFHSPQDESSFRKLLASKTNFG